MGLLALLLVGCAGHTAYRRGAKSVEPLTPAALTALCQKSVKISPRSINIAYVEIDEQGYFQDPGQVESAIDALPPGSRPQYVVVFVHGWLHNASETDEQLLAFKCALNDLQAMDTNEHYDVVGIYIGWRGESLQVPLLKYLTFWDRKNTSEEIGRGSLVEFLTRLERHLKPEASSPNRLMLVGHSFGASVVFNSISQILLERFIVDAEDVRAQRAPRRALARRGMISGYGDLVVLINPAIEAMRLMPFFTALNTYTGNRDFPLSPTQPPRLIVLSSEGDWATRKTFPAARAVSTVFEGYTDITIEIPSIKASSREELRLSERYLDWQAMGNVEKLYTHDPLKRPAHKEWEGKCPRVESDWLRQAIEDRKREQERQGQPATGSGWVKVFEGAGVELKHRGITVPSNPLWIMAVGTELIPDHNAITSPFMACLLDELLVEPSAAGSQRQ